MNLMKAGMVMHESLGAQGRGLKVLKTLTPRPALSCRPQEYIEKNIALRCCPQNTHIPQYDTHL